METIDVLTITQEELNQLPYSTQEIAGKLYKQIIIIPTDTIHDTGFRCMKYVLLQWNDYGPCEVVGVVGGYSDVLHLWRSKNGLAIIDCLPCGYLRILLDNDAKVPSFIGSDFFIYDAENSF